MIDVKELRIGNHLLQKHLKTCDKVLGIKDNYLLTTNDIAPNNWVGLGLYDPIPLTPEVLQKCGFEITYDSKFHTSWDADILGHGEIGYVIWHEKKRSNFRYYGEKDIPCQYLHQLMNLYFALTGEELIYTP